MQLPPIPADEEDRLKDLRQLDLLLTEPDEALDRITHELAHIFEVPGVMMSFIDRDTQYYKSAVGLPEDIAATRTEPRELSVCSFVIGSNTMLVVDDLLADERFRDNPIVVSSGARFYAGTPLRADTGRAIGTLCIVDNRPRAMGNRERELLRVIAEGVMAQVKLQRASRQLLERTKQIESDLQQAMQMQRFLLPEERLEGEGWRIGHLYRPVEYLGGDFLDLYRRPDNRWAILVADVSGHGTSASLTSVMAKTAFVRAAPSAETPSRLLGSIHRELVGTVPPGHFMTALAALFDPARRHVEMASAGHPPPLLVSGSCAEPVALSNELVLLVDPDQEYKQQATLTLSPGDRLLLYTDGAVEAAAPDGNRLTTTGLARYAGEVVGEHPRDFLEALFSRLADYTGNRFHDDVALLAIESV